MTLRAVAIGLCVALLASSHGAGQQGAGDDIRRFIKEPELVALCQKLIQIRSDYDEGVLANHREMAAFLGGELRKLGFEVSVEEPEPNYPTVIGRLRGTVGTPVYGMIAHYNTVAVGDRAKWTVDPFGGQIKDGKIYGRGAADQKMAMAASLIAAKAIREAGIKLKGDLILLYIPGEGAQTHSLPYIVKNKPNLLKADWYLDTEGGPDIVKIGGGWTWVKVSVDGTTGHTGGRAATGKRPVNAVYKMAKVLSAIEDIDTWMSYQKHPLFPNPLYDGKPIVEAGKIEGGYKVNQVPDHAEAQIDIRLLPGQSPDGVLKEMRALFARLQQQDPDIHASVEPMTTQWVPMKYWDSLTDDDALVKAIRDLATPLNKGRTPGWTGGIGGGRPDIWAVGAKWVSFALGGGGANAHGPDEYATIDGGVTRADFFARLILRVIGPSASTGTPSSR